MSAEEIPELDPATPPEPVRDSVQEMLDNLASEKFSLRLEEYEIPIEDKDGKVTIYKLRELDGEQRSDYINFQASKAKYGADGKVTGIKDFKGIETKIVSMCLYDPDGKLVTEAFLNKVPGRLIKKLSALALRISGLDEKAEERAKNS